MGGISVLLLIGLLSSMIIIILLLIIILIIWSILSYIFDSISIYHISKKLEYQNAFLSFLPIYNKVYLGRIAKKNIIGIVLSINDLIKIVSLYFFIYITNETLSSLLFYTIIITVISSIVLKIYLTYHIIKRVTPKYVDLLTALNSLTLGITRPFMLFIVRKNDKIVNIIKEHD